MGMLGCWGLVILASVYTVLGFFLAWIAQMVAREDVEVRTGVITLIVSGITWLLIQIALSYFIGDAANYTSTPVNFAVLTCSLHVIAKLSWKHSAIIAAIYAALLFLLFLAM